MVLFRRKIAVIFANRNIILGEHGMDIASFLKQYWDFWPEISDKITQEHVEEIMAILRENIQKFPYSSSLYVYLGNIVKWCEYFDFKTDDQDAQYYYEKAISLDPFCYRAYEEMALHFDILERLEDSKELYKIAHILTNDIGVAIGFSKIFTQLNQHADAQEIINESKNDCEQWLQDLLDLTTVSLSVCACPDSLSDVESVGFEDKNRKD